MRALCTEPGLTLVAYSEEYRTYLENASRLLSDTLVEDVEVARHRERDDAIFLGPCVADLLMGDARAERPSDLRLLRLDIPCYICEQPVRADGGISIQSFTVRSAAEVTSDLLSGLQSQAIYGKSQRKPGKLDVVLYLRYYRCVGSR